MTSSPKNPKDDRLAPTPGRNLLAVVARRRRGGAMKDHRQGRGGAYNRQGQWLTEWVEEQSTGPANANRE
jgi:hypothetical protein